jgi:hypothetical protein
MKRIHFAEEWNEVGVVFASFFFLYMHSVKVFTKKILLHI